MPKSSDKEKDATKVKAEEVAIPRLRCLQWNLQMDALLFEENTFRKTGKLLPKLRTNTIREKLQLKRPSRTLSGARGAMPRTY